MVRNSVLELFCDIARKQIISTSHPKDNFSWVPNCSSESPLTRNEIVLSVIGVCLLMLEINAMISVIALVVNCIRCKLRLL